MRTYGEAFRLPEFMPLFAATSIQLAAMTVSGLALGTLVYTSTGSPLLSALAMFGPSLAQVAGASVLLSAADRLPPRAVLTAGGLLAGLATLGQAVPGMPLGGIFAITALLGMIAPLGSGARYGLLAQILPADGYLLGRAVFNMANGIIQVVGYALGGVLVAVLSPRGALLCGALLWLLGAAGTWLGLRARPPRVTGRPSVTATWRANRRLWSSGPRRYAFLALWVPNGLIVGCEALFVAYAPRHAGLMFAFTALGMLAGDTLAGRFIPGWLRGRLGPWLRLLLAGPYLVFFLHPVLAVAVGAACVASIGYSASLMVMERLMRLTPEELSGHAMGLQSAGMQAMQGAGAALAGAVAGWTSPAMAIGVLAVASITVTLLLAPGLRGEVPGRAALDAGSDPGGQPRAATEPA